MKVITSESVIIQRIKAVPSKQSWTKNPSYMAKYSSLEGSDAASVKSFQEWANKVYSAQLVVDGIYGPKTKTAYSKWGAEWKKAQQAGTTNKDTTSPVRDAKMNEPEIATGKDKLTFMQKVKMLPMPAKVGIGLGAAAILGVIIWKLIPSKKG